MQFPCTARRAKLRGRSVRTWWSLFAAAALLLLPAGARAAISSQDSLLLNGQLRTFTIYLPDDNAGAARLPIFIVLHGGLGNGHYAARQTGVMNYVDRNKFIAVFPDGENAHWK